MELLSDFLSEITAQLALLKGFFGSSPTDFLRVKQVCHGMKGAAANLMCPLIRERALALERAGHDIHQRGGQLAEGGRAAVEKHYKELVNGSNEFKAMLSSMCVT